MTKGLLRILNGTIIYILDGERTITNNKWYYNMYVYTRPWVNKMTFVFGIYQNAQF